MFNSLKSLFSTPELVLDVPPPQIINPSLIHQYLLSAVTSATLSESEIAAIVLTEAMATTGNVITFDWPEEISDAFEKLQNEGVGFHSYSREKAEAIRHAEAGGTRFSLRAPDWRFGLSNDFIRSVEKVDKKTQGRILEAITKIAQSPTTIVGDTVKPLTADLKGLWRYRIGDYRLIYAPDTETKYITLLTFDSRGGAY